MAFWGSVILSLMNPTVAELQTLDLPERILLVEDLWDSIAADAKKLPVPRWQKDELARRKAKHRQNPRAGMTWDAVRRDVLGRHP